MYIVYDQIIPHEYSVRFFADIAHPADYRSR